MKTLQRIICIVLALLLLPCYPVRTNAASEIEGLTFLEKTPLQYAECFQVFRYTDGYSLIHIPESGDYLVVPENGSVPAHLDSGIAVLKQPIDRIYLAATSAMALFDALDAIDRIRLTGTQAQGWQIEAPVEALENGSMLFAGRYSEPDYEMLLLEDCSLAIESTMIFHTPKVKEMIEDLGIPVLIDRSSYESHPLGRTEWIKLYAVLAGKEKEADEFFQTQAAVIEQMKDYTNTGKTIAFFYVNSDGSIVVRNPSDYIPQMIELGGGKYLCPKLGENESSTSVSVTMESFYSEAWNADYLIYNSSIDAPLDTIEQLIAKDPLFADFTAVKNGNVWCTGKTFYQATDIVGQMICDIHNMLSDNTANQMTFLTRVD